jgi:hypothetical protein
MGASMLLPTPNSAADAPQALDGQGTIGILLWKKHVHVGGAGRS